MHQLTLDEVFDGTYRIPNSLLVIDWLKERGEEPNFFTVENVKEYRLEREQKRLLDISNGELEAKGYEYGELECCGEEGK